MIYNTGDASWTDWARDAYRAAGAAERLYIEGEETALQLWLRRLDAEGPESPQHQGLDDAR